MSDATFKSVSGTSSRTIGSNQPIATAGHNTVVPACHLLRSADSVLDHGAAARIGVCRPRSKAYGAMTAVSKSRVSRAAHAGSISGRPNTFNVASLSAEARSANQHILEVTTSLRRQRSRQAENRYQVNRRTGHSGDGHALAGLDPVSASSHCSEGYPVPGHDRDVTASPRCGGAPGRTRLSRIP
jgi:hypothetical protein